MLIGKRRNVYDETLFCRKILGLDPQEGKIFIKLFRYEIGNVLKRLTFQKCQAPFRCLQVSFLKQKPTNLTVRLEYLASGCFSQTIHARTLCSKHVSSTCLRTKTQIRKRDPQLSYKLWIVLQWIELWSLNNRAVNVWETERGTVLI